VSGIADAVSDTLESDRTSRLHSAVAILVALTATLMALGDIKDGNIVQSMSQEQARGVDAWNYYQAKSMKQHLAENMLAQLELVEATAPARGPVRTRLEALGARYARDVRRYEAEKDSARTAAEDHGAAYDALNYHDDQFDLAEACFSVALATYGISALTRRRWLLVMGLLLTAFGAVMTLAGFLGWHLHSDALSRVLS